MKVLIVEDEALLALSYRMSLGTGKCEVIGIAPDAAGAYEIINANRPDVILMDIKLKGNIDGIEAADHIIKTYEIPVIFVTGNTDEATREQAMKVRPLAYLEKPIDCEMLHQMLCVNNIP